MTQVRVRLFDARNHSTSNHPRNRSKQSFSVVIVCRHFLIRLIRGSSSSDNLISVLHTILASRDEPTNVVSSNGGNWDWQIDRVVCIFMKLEPGSGDGGGAVTGSSWRLQASNVTSSVGGAKRTRFFATVEAGASRLSASPAYVTHFRLSVESRLGPEVTSQDRLPVAVGSLSSGWSTGVRAEQRVDGSVAERIGRPQRRHRPSHVDVSSTVASPGEWVENIVTQTSFWLY